MKIIKDGTILTEDMTTGLYVTYTGGSGTGDYNDLTNLPSLNGVTIIGSMTLDDFGLETTTINLATTTSIDNLF